MINYDKKKSVLISSIFKNEKMAKDIADALKSAPGSSKRERVSSALRALHRTIGGNSAYNFGAGGAPDSVFNSQTSLFPSYNTPTPGMELLMNSNNSTPFIFKPAPIKQNNTPAPAANPTPSPALAGSTPSANGNVIPSQAPSGQGQITGSGIVTGPNGQPMAINSNEKITPNANISGVNTGVSPSGTIDINKMQDFGDTFLNQLWESYTPEQKAQFAPLFESVKSGIGAKTFTEKMLSDKEKLKALTGLPDEALPEGASLARNINSLEEALKKEYDINALADNVQKQASASLDIMPTLKDYIAGRDQYIEKINNLIDDTTDKVASLDMSDAKVAKPLNSYLNYLYVIKGRQQKRYTDMLQMGIDYQDTQYKKAQMAYDSAYNKFETAFKQKSSVTQEDYNKLYDMLGEMYNNLNTKADVTLERTQNQLNLLKTQNEILDDTFARTSGFKNATEMNTAKSNFTSYLVAKLGRTPTDQEFQDEWNKIPANLMNAFKSGTMDTTLINAMANTTANLSKNVLDNALANNGTQSIDLSQVPEENRNDVQKAVQGVLTQIDDFAKAIAYKNEAYVVDGKLTAAAIQWIKDVISKYPNALDYIKRTINYNVDSMPEAEKNQRGGLFGIDAWGDWMRAEWVKNWADVSK